eukprot:COSAG01_NODE_3046_length_6672_cov_4.249962_5_plen_56_part_00
MLSWLRCFKLETYAQAMEDDGYEDLLYIVKHGNHYLALTCMESCPRWHCVCQEYE